MIPRNPDDSHPQSPDHLQRKPRRDGEALRLVSASAQTPIGHLEYVLLPGLKGGYSKGMSGLHHVKP